MPIRAEEFPLPSLSRHISSFARLRIVSWDVHKQLGNCSVVRAFICAEGDEGIMSIGHIYTVKLCTSSVCVRMAGFLICIWLFRVSFRPSRESNR